MKREILTFSNEFSKGLSKPQKKFVADMTYGMHPVPQLNHSAVGSSPAFCLLDTEPFQCYIRSPRLPICNQIEYQGT